MLALVHEPAVDGLQQRLEPVEELLRGRLTEDVVTYRHRRPGHRSQLGHPVRVGQEPHVDDHVGIDRDAVLEAERHDRRPHDGVVAGD